MVSKYPLKYDQMPFVLPTGNKSLLDVSVSVSVSVPVLDISQMIRFVREYVYGN